MNLQRELPKITLDEIKSQIDLPGRETRVLANKVRLNLTGTDPYVRITDFDGTEDLPTAGVLENIGDVLKIPDSFLKKLDVDIAEQLINRLLERNNGSMMIRHSDMAILEMAPLGRKSVDPIRVIEVVEKVMPEETQVVEWWRDSSNFHLDVVVANPDARGANGDRKLGDMSLGGLRVNQRRGVPQVSQYWYRLACLNGMESEQTEFLSLKSQSADDFLIEFEALANKTFWQIEQSIEQFYELRKHPVESVEQAILRWSKQRGISDKTRMTLMRTAPEYFTSDLVADPDMPTRFDVANFLTNAAVDQSMPASARYALEAAGGAIVGHHSYCSLCQSEL